jgi:hypothetical protein
MSQRLQLVHGVLRNGVTEAVFFRVLVTDDNQNVHEKSLRNKNNERPARRVYQAETYGNRDRIGLNAW